MQEGLEAQLLGIVVRKEKPELEEQKDSLVIGIANGRKKLKELEDELLRLLNETQGSLLEDENLFITLQTSKVTSAVGPPILLAKLHFLIRTKIHLKSIHKFIMRKIVGWLHLVVVISPFFPLSRKSLSSSRYLRKQKARSTSLAMAIDLVLDGLLSCFSSSTISAP